MRTLLLLAFLVSGTVFGQEHPSWFAQSLLVLPEEIADAAREKKRVVVYFEQDGCPYCKRMIEVNFRDPAIAKKMQERFVAIALNIWGDREVTAPDGRTMSEKQLAAAFRVQFTPTMVFFDEKGGVALRINGYYPPERFLAALDAAAPGAPAAQRKLPGAVKPKREGQPVALIFEAPKCERCEELKATLQRKDVAPHLLAYQVERFPVPGPHARALGVLDAPTLILFDGDGREALRLDAYFRPFHVAGSLEYVASGAHKTEPSFQRFLQLRAERMRRAGERVDLWN